MDALTKMEGGEKDGAVSPGNEGEPAMMRQVPVLQTAGAEPFAEAPDGVGAEYGEGGADEAVAGAVEVAAAAAESDMADPEPAASAALELVPPKGDPKL